MELVDVSRSNLSSTASVKSPEVENLLGQAGRHRIKELAYRLELTGVLRYLQEIPPVIRRSSMLSLLI